MSAADVTILAITPGGPGVGPAGRCGSGIMPAVTKPGLSLLAVLLDRSSSVRPAADAIRSGVDALLADQAGEPGELLVTLAARNACGQETACVLRPVADVGPVALRPRAGSALYEGIGTLIDDVGTDLAGLAESERPERVIVLVVGDTGAAGGDAELVRERVQRQRHDYAWEFVAVDLHAHGGTAAPGHRDDAAAPAAPADRTDDARGAVAPDAAASAVAVAEARSGIPATALLVAGPGPDGVRARLDAASRFVSRARRTRPWEPVEGFTDDERAAAAVPAPARPGWWRRLLAGAGGPRAGAVRG